MRHFALALVVVALVGCGGAAQHARTAAAAEPAWRVVSPEGGAFSVEMPAEPTEVDQPPESPGASSIRLFQSTLPGDLAFVVGYGDQPLESFAAASPSEIFEEFMAHAQTAVRGQIASHADVAVDGNPGHEFFVNAGLVHIRARVVIAQNRVYQMNMTSHDEAAVHGPLADRYFAGLHLSARAIAPIAGWQTSTPEHENFSIDFPGTPVTTSEPASEATGPAMLVLELDQPSASRAFSFVRSGPVSGDMSIERANEMVDLAVQNVFRQMHADPTSVRSFEINGGPAREFTLAGNHGLVWHARAAVVEANLYLMLFTGPSAEASSAEVTRFFDSFHLAVAQHAAPVAAPAPAAAIPAPVPATPRRGHH